MDKYLSIFKNLVVKDGGAVYGPTFLSNSNSVKVCEPNNQLPTELQLAYAKRICECVNAFEGIRDPIEFKLVIQLLAQYIRDHHISDTSFDAMVPRLLYPTDFYLNTITKISDHYKQPLTWAKQEVDDLINSQRLDVNDEEALRTAVQVELDILV